MRSRDEDTEAVEHQTGVGGGPRAGVCAGHVCGARAQHEHVDQDVCGTQEALLVRTVECCEEGSVQVGVRGRAELPQAGVGQRVLPECGVHLGHAAEVALVFLEHCFWCCFMSSTCKAVFHDSVPVWLSGP